MAWVFLAASVFASGVDAQDFVASQPAGRNANASASLSSGLASEIGGTARDLVTFRDPKWTLLTMVQIAAASADAVTSLHNFHRCPTCVETGIARLAVGRRPDARQYVIAGVFEIGVEALAAHYLRHHSPIRKWYWRYVWTLPQSLSLYEHTRADFHNVGAKLTCNSIGMNCR